MVYVFLEDGFSEHSSTEDGFSRMVSWRIVFSEYGFTEDGFSDSLQDGFSDNLEDRFQVDQLLQRGTSSLTLLFMGPNEHN